MKNFIIDNVYYECDYIPNGGVEVEKRPDKHHIYDGGNWILLNQSESNEQIINRLKAELETIERNEIMPRKTREIQIQLMEFLAVQQGITPQQLALNPAYAGMKQIDAQCVVLRAQIRELS